MSCTSRIVTDIGVEQLSHLPHLTDLALSDLYLFRHLKKHLRRKRFCDDDEVKQTTESYLDSMSQEFYLTGMSDLFDQCRKCVDEKGDSIENDAVVLPVSLVDHNELQNFLIAPRSQVDRFYRSLIFVLVIEPCLVDKVVSGVDLYTVTPTVTDSVISGMCVCPSIANCFEILTL